MLELRQSCRRHYCTRHGKRSAAICEWKCWVPLGQFKLLVRPGKNAGLYLTSSNLCRGAQLCAPTDLS